MTVEPYNLARIAAAMAASGDVGYEWDLDSDLITWVGEPASLFGANWRDVLTGAILHTRLSAEDLPGRLRSLARHYRSGEPFDQAYRIRQPDGAFCWVHDRGRADFDAAGRPVRLHGILRRINRRKAYEVQLELSANFDGLTGQYNRARLRDALQQSITHALRYRGRGAFLLVDIDRLGAVNDRLGYAVADAVIVGVAQQIERTVRATDTVGRVGGDVFGIVLDQCAEAEMAETAGKLLELFRDRPVRTVHGPVPVTVSVGGVGYPDYVKTAFEAMSRAEVALGAAKTGGGGRFIPYRMSEAEQAEHRRSLEVGETVKIALRQDDFRLAFQPVVDAATGKVRFYECLLRMVQAGQGLVAAGAFVPVVERLGMARLIDRRVLEMAVDELGRDPDVRLAINISGFTASDRAWLRALVALLKDAPDMARRLVVEITETAAIQDIEETFRFIATARDLGCKVALDDFGAGYISYRHLK
ncbi:MAG TPA: EAL domain-containing protein, partial [Arenibaculum sp.]|nr:EAL domain-containing protein [Arenibaculum sp.]